MAYRCGQLVVAQQLIPTTFVERNYPTHMAAKHFPLILEGDDPSPVNFSRQSQTSSLGDWRRRNVAAAFANGMLISSEEFNRKA